MFASQINGGFSCFEVFHEPVDMRIFMLLKEILESKTLVADLANMFRGTAIQTCIVSRSQMVEQMILLYVCLWTQ